MSEKVIAKLAKIRNHAESAKAIGSEAEALHFANMLNELLMKHNLEMSDIEWEEEIKEEPVEKHRMDTEYDDKWKRHYKEYPDVEVKNKRCEWTERLARIVSRAHSCDFLIQQGTSKITFVGRKSNAAIVEYMFISMLRSIKKISQQEYNKKRNRIQKEIEQGLKYDYSELSAYRESWRRGFLRQLDAMLEEEKQKREADASNGAALMRINKDEIATRSFMDNLNCKSASGLSIGRGHNRAGFEDGKSKAKEIGIKKGVTTSARATK